MARILLVEADRSTAEQLAAQLVKQGHEVEHTSSGQDALSRFRAAELVLLEIDLPDLDGIEICRIIRTESDLPLITFSAGETHLERVLSLQAGADDCMVKPYVFRELVARMNAVLRRATKHVPSACTISRGPLRIDPRSRQVRLGDKVVDVTRKEFDLLYLLASHPDSVISRKELMSKVWADEWATSSRTIDTHVSTLRSKLGHTDWIMTVRGVGYRLGAQAWVHTGPPSPRVAGDMSGG